MNTFYERLIRFGALVHEASEINGEHYEELFTVIHPGHPVVSRERSITPSLLFAEECPVPIKRKVRAIMRKAFSRKAVVA